VTREEGGVLEIVPVVTVAVVTTAEAVAVAAVVVVVVVVVMEVVSIALSPAAVMAIKGRFFSLTRDEM
jgi:hypothetical protein